MNNVNNRLMELRKQGNVTGVHYVKITPATQRPTSWLVPLQVHFHETTRTTEEILKETGLSSSMIVIQSLTHDRTDPLVIENCQWVADSLPYLQVDVDVPVEAASDNYQLSVIHENVDPYFKSTEFSFRAQCDQQLDWYGSEAAPEDTTEHVDFPVDYQARDFSSFRGALLDFASQRYPQWEDRLEADMGIMLVEAMSALGDEMAYYQDRVGREAHLETATQRRSVRRHARLVDYSMHDGLSSSTWLSVTAKADGEIAAGSDVWCITESGNKVFEIGRGLDETLAGRTYPVLVGRNEFAPYFWDEDDFILPAGETSLCIEGKHAAVLNGSNDIWLLLQSDAEDASKPIKRLVVRLAHAVDERDRLLAKDFTRLIWDKEFATPCELDLRELQVFGNIVPATAGRTESALFAVDSLPPEIPNELESTTPLAVERLGANGSVSYRFSIPQSDKEGLSRQCTLWLGNDPHRARPEIVLREVRMVGEDLVEVPGGHWQWQASFLGNDQADTTSSQRMDQHYVLDDGVFKKVVSYMRDGQKVEHVDYASANGCTIRFGEGEFGRAPGPGTLFQVHYRLGVGESTNLVQDTLLHIEDDWSELVESVRNPLPITNGVEPESIAETKRVAPIAYQVERKHAVFPDDYSKSAEELDWVQRAGTTFRWTGSWVSSFTSADPMGAIHVTDPQEEQLTELLDRRRMAGRECYVKEPRYADLDLLIEVHVDEHSYQDEVRERVMEALLGEGAYAATGGFFSADNFTFGTPLERSKLEAVISAVEGVLAVGKINIYRRGYPDHEPFVRLSYEVAMNEVIRIENNPHSPFHGAVRLDMKGGA